MTWDYIVVGGGTAGCVVASRLCASAAVRVLLIEAGSPYPRSSLGPPLPGMRQTTRFSWKYFTTQQQHLAHRRLSLPMGRVVGGSSSVNAMMYCRGNPRDYDGWAEAGNRGWAFSAVAPYFCRAENWSGRETALHGKGGPLDVSPPRHVAPFSAAFVDACVETGVPRCEELDSAAVEAAGFFPVTQKRGIRASTARAYLGRQGGNPSLQVITDAQVSRILIEHARAIGVEYRCGRDVHRAHADAEVILCAGAFGSPQLLMLSGVGPADHLVEVGIQPVLDLPGVGANLQDHVRVPVLFESGRSSPGDMARWIPAAIDFAVRRRGVMTSNCCEAGAFLASRPGLDAPDLQFVTHFQSHLYPGAVDLQFCLVETASRGAVRLRSRDPETPPEINPCYLSALSDLSKAVAGLRIARRLANTEALRRFPLGREIMPGDELAGDRELEHYVRSSAETCYHPAGTCRMGCDAMAVVDDRLRLRGIDRLRVADASIMPELPHGNTLAPTVMIAERAAEWILRPE